MESRNSVLLNGKGNLVVEEAVRPAPQCVPQPPQSLEYHWPVGWLEDGSPVRRDDYAQVLGESGRRRKGLG